MVVFYLGRAIIQAAFVSLYSLYVDCSRHKTVYFGEAPSALLLLQCLSLPPSLSCYTAPPLLSLLLLYLFCSCSASPAAISCSYFSFLLLLCFCSYFVLPVLSLPLLCLLFSLLLFLIFFCSSVPTFYLACFVLSSALSSTPDLSLLISSYSCTFLPLDL